MMPVKDVRGRTQTAAWAMNEAMLPADNIPSMGMSSRENSGLGIDESTRAGKKKAVRKRVETMLNRPNEDEEE